MDPSVADGNDLAAVMEPSGRVQTLRRVLDAMSDGLRPVLDLYRPYVDGLENLPANGRFLLVGNHTQSGAEVFMISDAVRREIGTRVRPLADRGFGRMRGLPADLLNAYGAVIGAPETARELMRHNQTVLVFPGGGREIAKYKGEEYALRWQGRAGFARVAAENGYPIVPAALVGGDDVYRSLTTRDSVYAKFSEALGRRLNRRPDMAMPLMRGIGPTLIPRPQRMYLRFGAPINTTRPRRVGKQAWAENVKHRTQVALEQLLDELLRLRETDPYRTLNPLAWRDATRPEELSHAPIGK
jgi:1-acyl-sn-glycerol-3-phosphate acyltransferase